MLLGALLTVLPCQAKGGRWERERKGEEGAHLPCHFSCPSRLQLNICLSPVIGAGGEQPKATVHPSQVAWASSQERARGKRWECRGQRDALVQHLCAGGREAAETGVSLLCELLPWALAVPSEELLACRSLCPLQRCISAGRSERPAGMRCWRRSGTWPRWVRALLPFLLARELRLRRMSLCKQDVE